MGTNEQLEELPTVELIKLQNSITRILQEREVSEDVIRSTIEHFDDIKRGSTRYTDLTLYLEKRGFKREAIARRLVNMWRRNTSIAEGGCPIGEEESEENPIHPHVDNVDYYQICYLRKRW